MFVAADFADWLEKEQKKSDDLSYGNQEKARKKEIEAFVEAHPNYIAVAVVWDLVDDINNVTNSVLSGRALSNFSTGFVVDLAKLGTGFGDGSALGIFQDVLRVISIVPWGRAADFVGTQAFRVAGPVVSRFKQFFYWGAVTGETCVPISVAKAMELTGTKLFITLEDAARAMGKDLSLIRLEGAGNTQLRTALKELKALFDEIPVGEIKDFSEVAILARNTKGVLLVSLETTVANGRAAFHQVVVSNTGKGFKIFDRYGTFNSFEELARRYPNIGKGGFKLDPNSPLFIVKNWAVDEALISKLHKVGPLGMIVLKGVQMVIGFNPEIGGDKIKEEYSDFVAKRQPDQTQPAQPIPQTPLKFVHQVVGPRVERHDWLSSIAQKWYGDMLLWPILFDFNRGPTFTDPNRIIVGQMINVPDISTKTAAQLNEYRQRGRNWRHAAV